MESGGFLFLLTSRCVLSNEQSFRVQLVCSPFILVEELCWGSKFLYRTGAPVCHDRVCLRQFLSWTNECCCPCFVFHEKFPFGALVSTLLSGSRSLFTFLRKHLMTQNAAHSWQLHIIWLHHFYHFHYQCFMKWHPCFTSSISFN